MTDRLKRLLGIGVGPGDAELITIKAVRALEEADLILVPAADTSESEVGRAEAIILESCQNVAGRIQRIPFSMSARRGVDEKRSEAWQTSADAAVAGFETGARTIAFATIGDPSVYSTFSYLADSVRRQIPDLIVEVIPGITAMQALAAASTTPLVEGQEILALVPVTAGIEAVGRVLDNVDTVVAYKVGRQLEAVFELLVERGRDEATVIGVNVGLPDQIVRKLNETSASPVPYFSTLLVPPSRGETGSRI